MVRAGGGSESDRRLQTRRERRNKRKQSAGRVSRDVCCCWCAEWWMLLMSAAVKRRAEENPNRDKKKTRTIIFTIFGSPVPLRAFNRKMMATTLRSSLARRRTTQTHNTKWNRVWREKSRNHHWKREASV